jgi:hypothetical protein
MFNLLYFNCYLVILNYQFKLLECILMRNNIGATEFDIKFTPNEILVIIINKFGCVYK